MVNGISIKAGYTSTESECHKVIIVPSSTGEKAKQMEEKSVKKV